MEANLQSGLHAIGEPTRLAILRRIAERPMPVGSLARSFPLTRSAISQHLRILKDAGLVHDVAEGTQRVYHIDPAGIEALKAHFDALWTTVLAQFKAAAESGEEFPPTQEPRHVRRTRPRSSAKRG